MFVAWRGVGIVIRKGFLAFTVAAATLLPSLDAAARCRGTTVVYRSGDFVLSFDLWEEPDDEVGEIRYRPTGKRLEVFSIHLGTDGKNGSWSLDVRDRHCRDINNCEMEGDVEILQPGPGDKEPPKEIRIIGLADQMAKALRPAFWPDGAQPGDRFTLADCRR